ncbi:TauD/TfdA family dioxygenase [Bordetella sp. 2513F-2]
MLDLAANAKAGTTGWMGQDLAKDESRWITHLTEQDIAEIESALAVFNASGKTVEEMTRADFPLSAFAGKIDGYINTIRNGLGFIILRGLPVARYSDADAGAIFYGLGLYLGSPVPQNPQGDVLGRVYDQGRKYGELDVRGYETNALLPFHTDGCEMVGLLCLRQSKRGGLSSLSSSVSVFKEIEKTHPEYLQPLFAGYRYIRREAALTDDPVSPPISVFGVKDGVVSCRLVPNQIEAAAKRLGEPIVGLEREAFDELLRLCKDERFRLDMDLQRGDIQLVNNYTVLHSRTEYEDYPEPERKRCMLRLWISFDEAWPLPPEFPRQLGYSKGQLAERHLA